MNNGLLLVTATMTARLRCWVLSRARFRADRRENGLLMEVGHRLRLLRENRIHLIRDWPRRSNDRWELKRCQRWKTNADGAMRRPPKCGIEGVVALADEGRRCFVAGITSERALLQSHKDRAADDAGLVRLSFLLLACAGPLGSRLVSTPYGEVRLCANAFPDPAAPRSDTTYVAGKRQHPHRCPVHYIPRSISGLE